MYDVVSVGRISADFYANEPGTAFSDPQTFTKTIGGSPTSVAVAAVRLGHRTALVTKVGGDSLGQYVVRRLREYGVDTSFVGTAEWRTPVVLASLAPPEAPEIAFFRDPDAPDTTLVAADVPDSVIQDCAVLWMSACALARGTTADACLTWMRGRTAGHTVLDLDYRPTFWRNPRTARDAVQPAIDAATVVVANTTESFVMLGESDPDRAADALLERGVAIAIVKLGDEGVLLADANERHRIAPIPVEVVCGLGAGDAFGGALIHGLINEWPLDKIGEYGNAAGAIVASEIMCCDANPTIEQIDALLRERGRLTPS